ncbi:YitT family protein [Oceanospirillum sp.]|uniref:YitT family protein n=1 Tax=Oceanospirillum sp. TaxID=2021254 RepID=UPI003A9078E4
MKRHAHNWLGILEGSFLMALGILFLQSSQVAVGGITGVGLIGDRLLADLSFGQVFLVINLPFYLLAYYEKGWAFTLRTALAVTLIGVLTDLIGQYVVLDLGSAVLGALAAGALMAFGIVTLFQHNASTGGFTVLALYMERVWGVNRGWALLVIDAITIGIGLWLFGAELWFASLLVTVVMGLIIGRYRQQNTQPKLQNEAQSEKKAEKDTSGASDQASVIVQPAQS